MISTPYDHIADQFSAARAKLQPKEAEYLDALLDSLEAGGTILDLGCGTGHPIATHIVSRGHLQPMVQKFHRWLKPGGRTMVSGGGVVVDHGSGFTDTMFGHEFFYDSLPPDRIVATIQETGLDIVIAEICEEPDGARNRGKWAIVASRKAQAGAAAFGSQLKECTRDL